MATSAGGVTHRKRAGKGGPNPVDAHVGTRVRLRRILLGMSQEKLAKAVSLTFQQIQKYERGSNRIGASRLFQFAKVLDVSVLFFYDEMPVDCEGTLLPAASNGEVVEQNQFARSETRELVRAYYRIVDSAVRRRVFELTKTLSHSEERRAKNV